IYGGGRRDLNKRDKLHVPLGIELLFENKLLDKYKILLLLDSFAELGRTKYILFLEIVYYYSVASLNSKINPYIENKPQQDVSNLIMRFEKELPGLLLDLYGADLIEVKKEKQFKRDKIRVKITMEGRKLVVNFDDAIKKEYTEIVLEESYTNSKLIELRKGERYV
ncbi:hypothetical protein, partial [Listeria booriae]|uniref:hypothetical protein n=1 Tax=Listeria booriae TaxID=1552123 RepID=UPI001C8CCFA4